MNLYKKKNQIQSQVEKLNFRIHEIHYAKNSIERDITAEFQAMLERLKQAEAAKVLPLTEDADELQQEILRIDDMVKNIDELLTVPMEPPEFMTKSRHIDQWVEFVMAKPMKIVPDINPYDLPQELKIVREKLNVSASFQEMLDFKDQVIHKLLKEKEGHEKRLREEYEKKFQEELNEWSK